VQREGKPHFGSVVAKIKGSVDPVIPSFVDLFPTMQHRPYNSPNAGFLGRSSQAVKVDSNDLGAMELKGRSFSEFQDRKKLLSQIDFLKENAATQLASMDANYHRAFDVLTSNKLLQAMDIQRESPKVIERYGHGTPKHMGDGAPMWNDQLLIARRLVEAGVRVVTVAYGFWDTHGQNFRHLKEHLPLFDRGISALVEDLYDRGLDKECTLLVWGEFGRSPKINKDAGRDHWSPVNSAIFAGGGLKVGQVLGSTDSTAATAKDFPIHYRDVLATVYSTLGIDCHSMIYDVSNRPNPILPPEAKPISRLF
ncbi:MAG: DUF1501 domain-containing protein, partial [Gemmataceae bacterium]